MTEEENNHEQLLEEAFESDIQRERARQEASRLLRNLHRVEPKTNIQKAVEFLLHEYLK